jgi:hypothetical protein
MECINYLDGNLRRVAVKNIFHRLKPGGWFLFSSPIDDGTRYFSNNQSEKLIEHAGFRIERIKYNYAKSYTKIETPLLKLLQLSRIMEEISKTNYKGMLSRKKEILRRTLRIPLFGFVLKNLISMILFNSRKILESHTVVNFFQTISREVLKNRGISHILILAIKNE